MAIPREHIGVMMALQRLGEIFGISDLAENAKLKVQTNDGWVWDAVVTIRDHSFGLEWRRSGSLSHVAVATHQLKNLRSSPSNKVTPILAVPYMGKGAQELCEQAQLCWLDLSRNGRIVTASIFYQNLGNPNRFSQRGRPESAFGPRGSRIARRLLMDPSKAVRQRDLAKGTGLDEGHVSRVVGKLLEIGLVERGEDGMRVVDVDALLNAWRGDYRFDRHHVIRGHIPVDRGEALTRFLAETLSKTGDLYAVTGLPAAWLWTRYTPFHLATVYISTLPSPGLKKVLGFQEEAGEANVWLVVPNDKDVFHGAELVDAIQCVHPVQAYVDLKSHPEPATEAAAELRRLLRW